MIKIKPRETIDFNEAYDFKTGSELKYTTTIVIDGLNDDLVLMPWHMPEVGEVSFCKCKDFAYRQGYCKHIIECFNLLKSMNINYRIEERPIKPKKLDGSSYVISE